MLLNKKKLPKIRLNFIMNIFEWIIVTDKLSIYRYARYTYNYIMHKKFIKYACVYKLRTHN